MKAISIIISILILIQPLCFAAAPAPSDSSGVSPEKNASLFRERCFTWIGWACLVAGLAGITIGIADKTEQNAKPYADRDHSYREYLVAGGMAAGVGVGCLFVASIERDNPVKSGTTFYITNHPRNNRAYISCFDKVIIIIHIIFVSSNR